MATLDIRPHSRRVSAWAIALMAVIAAGAFAEGLGRSLDRSGASPFPPPQAASFGDDIAVATPAPILQVAPPPVRHAASAPGVDTEAADASATADAAAPPVLDVPPMVTPAATPASAPPASAATSDEAPH